MRTNRILAVLGALLNHGGIGKPGLTRGEIRRAACLPNDCETTRPIRDLRKQPYEIYVQCVEKSENGERVWRYHIEYADEVRARAILNSHKPAHT